MNKEYIIDTEYLDNELQELAAGKREAVDIIKLLCEDLDQSLEAYNELFKEYTDFMEEQIEKLATAYYENEQLLRQNLEYQEVQDQEYPFVPAILYRLDKQQKTIESLENAVIGLELKLEEKQC